MRYLEAKQDIRQMEPTENWREQIQQAKRVVVRIKSGNPVLSGEQYLALLVLDFFKKTMSGHGPDYINQGNMEFEFNMLDDLLEDK